MSILKIVSAFGYLVMVGGLIVLLVMRCLFSPSAPIIVVQAAAVALLLWARITFGRRSFHVVANATAGGLVTSGPYRFIRHPIYTSMCLFVSAAVLAHWSWKTALIGTLVFISAIVRLLCEEVLVSAQYPEYREYAARTWRMIPCIF